MLICQQVISQISILRDASLGFPGVKWAPKGAASWPLDGISVTVRTYVLQASAHRGEVAQLKKGAADGA
jgi:hypothetical protein